MFSNHPPATLCSGKKAIALLVLLGFVPAASARLGENLDQLTRRFGHPFRATNISSDEQA